MTKIVSVKINGLRGVRDNLKLDLGQNSLLLFGENGSGKSSITDAIEWFYTNRIGHLVGEEIGRSGLEGLRNIFLNEEDKGTIAVDYSDNTLNAGRSIFLKKESLQSNISNTSEEFKLFLADSQKENLILRHGDLEDFILASKREKLDTLSEIIGFREVSKVREALRKIVGELTRDFKRGDFDNRISNLQAKIIEQLGRVVTSEGQFIDAVNELIAPLEIGRTVTRFDEIGEILNLIQKPGDSKNTELQLLYDKISQWLPGIPATLNEIERLYNEYHQKFHKIIGDIEKISKIMLEKLVDEGIKVIKSSAVSDDRCPLCLQPKNRNDLLTELEARLHELQQTKSEKLKLDEQKETLKRSLKEPLQRINYSLSEKYMGADENHDLKEKLELLKTGLENYSAQLNIEISTTPQLKIPKEMVIEKKILDSIDEFCKQKIEELKLSRSDDLRFDIHEKILLSREAYQGIIKQKKEKEALEHQQRSMDLIYKEFLKKQQDALESFLSQFSQEIDEIYQYLNPGEKVENIELIPLEKDDELVGLTLEFKFFENSESPPQKYLSESHLNCLGLAFFLTSAKAFNKRNKFFIMDDVISSFDETHKKRFSDLLMEKFSDYQIILLTHEKNWFEEISPFLEEQDWAVNTIKWDTQKGACIDDPKAS